MADMLVRVTNVALAPPNLVVDFEAQLVATGVILGSSKSFNAASATAGNALTAFKNAMITFAQDNFGVTLTAGNILVFGGSQ